MVLDLWTAMPHKYKDPSQPQDRAACMHNPRGCKQADPCDPHWPVSPPDWWEPVSEGPFSKDQGGQYLSGDAKLTSCLWACTHNAYTKNTTLASTCMRHMQVSGGARAPEESLLPPRGGAPQVGWLAGRQRSRHDNIKVHARRGDEHSIQREGDERV